MNSQIYLILIQGSLPVLLVSKHLHLDVGVGFLALLHIRREGDLSAGGAQGRAHPSSIPLSNVSFYVPILGSKKGTCLSDGPALRGFQKRKLAYSFERISCSGHLKSESAVVRVH